MRPSNSPPSTLVDAATCVWNQYYPDDHNIAAVTFLNCFRHGEQWAPLLQCDLTQANATVVRLHYQELIGLEQRTLSEQ
ncbi:unnamed protein product [Hyaloperonospora brassicae]|uniref:Uncharacterized protein n=1 Tax=Hyaloperonospora brassicae TaxID=162125 RepID=A0AAV0TM15_HYABA|nr:unnamed protein product [Hyaloperonospora brassicae]